MAQISKEELAEQKETAKGVLINSYKMYEKSIADMLKRRKDAKDKDGNPIYSEKDTEKALRLMETMQNDVKDRFIALGGTEEELKAATKSKKKAIDRSALMDIMKKDDEKKEMAKYFNQLKDLNFKGAPKQQTSDDEEGFVEQDGVMIPEDVEIDSQIENRPVEIELPTQKSSGMTTKNYGNRIQWDNVPLPSKGECYKNKMDKVPVAYLTAYDENLIVSPNLYKDGTFLDELVKSKLMNSSVKLDDLLPGDRDAIILWLRGTSYGTDFPVTASDSETGKEFDTVVDLTEIHPKPFNLKGDADGYFDFELPVSKDKVKFRFLTYGDLKRLDMLDKEEQLGIKKRRINEIVNELKEYVDADEKCERTLKRSLTTGIENFNKYTESIEEDERAYSHMITNKLILSIASINGVDNRDYINEYVTYMNVRDSSALRKYITENEPGLDFNVEVERPESLGGGSVRMFLTLDQFIFLNIA